MSPETNTPAAVGAAGRGNDISFGKPVDNTVASLRIQLVGSMPGRLVALELGAVVAWASLDASVFRIHVVSPLHLNDARLATFRQIVGCGSDVIVCLWGTP